MLGTRLYINLQIFVIGSLVVILFTSLQNFIAIKQEEPCLRRKYGDFQKVFLDQCLNIAEISFS